MTEKQLEKIKEQVDGMDNAFWEQEASKMILARECFEINPNPETELAAEKARIDFEIAEIRYNGYLNILQDPRRSDEIIQRVKAEIKDKLNALRKLGVYHE